MKIGFIGSEPAGPVLAKAWVQAGHEVIGYVAHDDLTLERIDSLLPGVPRLSELALLEQADLILLAVTDQQVELVCGELVALGSLGPQKLLVHLSPLRGYKALASAEARGAVPIALHPLMHFTGTSVDLLVLKNSTIAVSAPEVLVPIAQALAIELGGEPIVVAENQRAAFAEAFEVASSFSSLVVQQAIGILEQAEVLEPAKLIGPVVRSAVEKALYKPTPALNAEDAQ
jgi:predicted short-subunit dehydrogenase-like oxidoreductase (DUF2520 family)